MVSDKSLFQRLKKNFSTDVVIRNIGGGKLKVLDVENILSYGQLQTNSLIDRFTRLHRAGQNMQYNPTMNYQTLRLQLYTDYEAMDTDPILSTTLDILAEEATLEGDKKEVLSIRSSDENIQAALYNLFYDVLNIPFSLPMWIRSMAKYGDFYLKLELAEKYGVYGAKPLSVYDMVREEGNDPNNPGYIRYIYDQMAVAGGTQASRNKQIFENYEIAHFRNLTDTNYLPYGRSYLEPARKLYKQYILMMDAMLIHRIMRAPEKRIFFVNVGNIPPNEVNAFMQQHVNALKKTPYIDPQTGDYNLKFNMQNMMEDFHVPIRPGDNTTRIDTAKGLEYDGIKDVEFLRDLMLAAIKVPKAILNYSDELNGKSTISALDLRFSHTVEKIQRLVISELKKIAFIHLYILGYEDSDLVNFSLSMNNPSLIDAQEKVALMKEKVALHKEMKETSDFSSDWIMDKIWDMSEDEILEERDLVVFDKERAFRYNQIETEGNDPAQSGESYGTPHDLATIYKNNSSNDVPDGYEDPKDDKKLGRPKEKASIYKTDDSMFGRDPLGSKGMKDSGKEKNDVKVKPMALENKNNISVIEGLKNRFKKKNILIFESKKDQISMIDENNLLDDILN